MNAKSLNHLWNYLQGLAMTSANRRWLAGKLIEASLNHSPENPAALDTGCQPKRMAVRVKRRAENVPADEQLEALFAGKEMPALPPSDSWKEIINANTGKVIKPMEKWL